MRKDRHSEWKIFPLLFLVVAALLAFQISVSTHFHDDHDLPIEPIELAECDLCKACTNNAISSDFGMAQSYNKAAFTQKYPAQLILQATSSQRAIRAPPMTS